LHPAGFGCLPIWRFAAALFPPSFSRNNAMSLPRYAAASRRYAVVLRVFGGSGAGMPGSVLLRSFLLPPGRRETDTAPQRNAAQQAAAPRQQQHEVRHEITWWHHA